MPLTGNIASENSFRPLFLSLVLAACALTMAGCAFFPDVRRKPQIINPFPQLQTVAVLPFFNQSEEPTLSGQRVAMAYMHELQAIRGFEVLPLGAVQGKMLQFNRPLSSGEDFQAFAQFLGVDAVLVGSVTDYQPYYPPRMTMKVNWYATNPGFHPVLPGYGLPWGTKQEKEIPKWIHLEAQRALAAEQLKTQTPSESSPSTSESEQASNSADAQQTLQPELPESSELPIESDANLMGNQLPAEWPDPRGFIPDPPAAERPPMLAQHEPVIAHVATFNGHDEDLTEQLADYYYFRDDARFGGWQAYLQRSEDFIRFCCYLHLSETLSARGGRDKGRLILRWPVDRYTR